MGRNKSGRQDLPDKIDAKSVAIPSNNPEELTSVISRRALLDVIPICIFEASIDGKCIYVNEYWSKLTGYVRQHALGNHWVTAIHAVDKNLVEAHWKRFVHEREPFDLEFRITPANNETRWCHAQASVYSDNRGNIQGYIGTVTDISKQKQGANQIELALDRLNEAQRLAKVGSWELDLLQNKLTWSLEIFRMFEVDQNKFEASYEAFLAAIHPEDREAVNAAYSNSLVTREPYEIVHRLQMKNGRIKYVRETCTSYFDADGKPTRSVGTVQDITELHKAELELKRYKEHLEELIDERTNQLQESEERLLRAQKIAKLGHWFLSSDGTLMWSSELYEIFGRVESQYSPSISNLFENTHPDDRQLVRDFFSMDASNQVAQIDHRIILSNGELRWLHQEAQFTFDQDGNITGLTGITQDISRRKRTEEELKLAKTAAERANRSKSEFLSRMSHELRTPMNAILGFAQVLNLELESQEQKDYAWEIQVAGDHLLDLINELLDLSRIEAGKLSMDPRDVALGKVLGEAVRISQSAMKKYNVDLSVDCDAELAVIADATRLKQIVVNLLTNSAKYNRAGGRVHLRCQKTQKTVRIGVTDTGYGISEDNLAKLFKPFERLGAEFSSVEGTGVGLALSKQLAELMHGSLTVESKLGTGTTFWLELPRTKSVTQKITAEKHSAPENGDKDARHTILYIEDNVANIRVVEAMFKRRPALRLLVAHDSQSGLEMAMQLIPDVILLDIHLPGMDGYQILEIMQSDSKTRHIPVVALSADAMPNDIEKGLSRGFKDYITKPVKFEHLFAVLDKLTSDANSAKKSG